MPNDGRVFGDLIQATVDGGGSFVHGLKARAGSMARLSCGPGGKVIGITPPDPEWV